MRSSRLITRILAHFAHRREERARQRVESERALAEMRAQLTRREQAITDYRSSLLLLIGTSGVPNVSVGETGRLLQRLGLERSDVRSIHLEAGRAVWQRAAQDGRFTDLEKKMIEDLTRELDLTLQDIGFDQEQFTRGYTLQKIESGEGPPPVIVEGLPVVLKDGEHFYWACPASLHKRKMVTTRVNFGGPIASIAIMKGVRFKLGSLAVHRTRTETLATEDVGTLWLTNERVGFSGPRKNFAFPYSKIASFEVTGEGLSMVKQGRETPYLVMPNDLEVPCAVISYVLNR